MRIVILLVALLVIGLSLIVFDKVIVKKEAEEESAICVELWVCSDWSPCVKRQQNRTCYDAHNCGAGINKPKGFQECRKKPQPPPEKPEPNLEVTVTLGQEERVYDWATDACPIKGIPDVPAHAIRNYKNEIILPVIQIADIAPTAPVRNSNLKGQDFDHLKRSCSYSLIAGNNWDASALDHQEWIASAYTEDGKIVHALIHNEYHDPYAPNCRPGYTQPSNLCWYNFISYAVSHDGGYTFTQPPSPNHVVAILPLQWDPTKVAVYPGRAGAKRDERPSVYGYVGPSNIIKRNDGYYYAVFFALTSPTDPPSRGTCIMRTKTLENPASWLVWDGKDFAIPRVLPYPQQPPNPQQYICAFVSHDVIRDLHGNILYSTYLGKYILVGAGIFEYQGDPLTCGFWFSWSDDLIEWSQPRLIKKANMPYPPCVEQKAPGIITEAYPSLIDHTDASRSFSTVGQNAYLYFMRDNGNEESSYLDRDLIRIPVTFHK